MGKKNPQNLLKRIQKHFHLNRSKFFLSSKLFVRKSLKSQKDENFIKRKKSENYFIKVKTFYLQSWNEYSSLLYVYNS